MRKQRGGGFVVVYVDVLFGVNFILDVLLLYITAKLAGQSPRLWRYFCGGALGAAYSVLMFFPGLPWIYSLGCKLLFSAVLVACVFAGVGRWQFFKTLLLFYAANFLLGGGVYALLFLFGAGSSVGAVYKNGVFYFELPFSRLALLTALAYGVITLAWRVGKSHFGRRHFYTDITVTLGDRTRTLRALADTGNSLRLPFSDKRVIVADLEAVEPLLPVHVYEAFCKKDYTLLDGFQIKLVPFRAVGTENGLLWGFDAEAAFAGRAPAPAVIAVCHQRLGTEYQALVGGEFLTENSGKEGFLA